MITRKQKQRPTADSQKIKRRWLKHTITENHQFTKEDSKKGRKELQNSQKAIIKVALVNPSISIITLHGTGLNLQSK